MEQTPKEYENQIDTIIIDTMKELLQMLEEMLERCNHTMHTDLEKINEFAIDFIAKHGTTPTGVLCDHNFVDDSIDIDPDRSTQIVYCDKCYITKT